MEDIAGEPHARQQREDSPLVSDVATYSALSENPEPVLRRQGSDELLVKRHPIATSGAPFRVTTVNIVNHIVGAGMLALPAA